MCAVGTDPNSGIQIEPSCVGYADIAGDLYFTKENLTLNISTISKDNATGMHSWNLEYLNRKNVLMINGNHANLNYRYKNEYFLLKI